MPSRKWSAKDLTTLAWDPDSQPMRWRSLAVPCDHVLIGQAAAAPPAATRNFRLPMWTVIEPPYMELLTIEDNFNAARNAPKRPVRVKNEVCDPVGNVCLNAKSSRSLTQPAS